MSSRLLAFTVILAFTLPSLAQLPEAAGGQWPTYGGDSGGQRFSASNQINRTNVSHLHEAWTFHTGALGSGKGGSFESTPILFKDELYLTSPFDEVFSIDPETGAKRWSYDPILDYSRKLGITTSRGVASWASSPGSALAGGCSDRIFLGTLDGRLIALDASTGRPCVDFGKDSGHEGFVDLTKDVDYRKGDNYSLTSPPTVIGDVVVVGSGIEDNRRVDVELGVVRGFDVKSGKLLWTWEPIPWAKTQKVRTGAANTWGVISADPEHGMVYLPVSSPSPDYYGGMRPGDNRDADSLVALDARTGTKVWAFQVVHHDIWDYDIAAEPLLFTFRGSVPAVAIATKMGMVFVLNRLTGEPLYPVHERPVPQTDVPGEVTSPTQPFQDLPPLSPLTLDLSKPLAVNATDESVCRNLIASLRYDGIYTPPSLRGSLLFPSNIGGVNWGSAALDPATGILYANTNRSPFSMKLQKRPMLSPSVKEKAVLLLGLLLFVGLFYLAWKLKRGKGVLLTVLALAVVAVGLMPFAKTIKRRLQRTPWLDTGDLFAMHFGKEYGLDEGAPYVVLRQPVDAVPGRPCSPLPWGAVSALNLNTGQTAWQAPLGTKVEGQHTGTVNVGGPMVTAGGLVFTAASEEPYLRAFDSSTGEELWRGALPVPAQATPMSYTLHGKQYVVVSAGGHSAFGTALADAVMAFSVP